MKTLQELKKEQMQNPEFVKEYEAIQPEMDGVRDIVDARIMRSFIQKELTEGTSINQADIKEVLNDTYLQKIKYSEGSCRDTWSFL